jgi:hypothetical protein
MILFHAPWVLMAIPMPLVKGGSHYRGIHDPTPSRAAVAVSGRAMWLIEGDLGDGVRSLGLIPM